MLTFLQAYSIDCECGLTQWVYAHYTEDLLFLSAQIISAQDEIYITQSVCEPEQNKAVYVLFNLVLSYLDVLFQLCIAGADHAHASLPLQLALLIVVGYTRGHPHATGCRAFAPVSGLNDAIVPCALRLDILTG